MQKKQKNVFCLNFSEETFDINLFLTQTLFSLFLLMSIDFVIYLIRWKNGKNIKLNQMRVESLNTKYKLVNEPLIGLLKEKFFHKKHWWRNLFRLLCHGHFLAKVFFEGHSSGHTGSNDTGLKFVWCLGADKKGGQTDKQTDFQYYK
jgi:hypothetical protein